MFIIAIKMGFLKSYKPIIGLDGCLLKEMFRGQLLMAIAKDPNDQYFPLEIAIIELEINESWLWFFEILLRELGTREDGCSYLTNRRYDVFLC